MDVSLPASSSLPPSIRHRIVTSRQLRAISQPGPRGDVLGRLGNTGNTSNPHLHFHITDRPSALASNGFPFVITNQVSAGVETGLDAVFSGRLPLNKHLATFE